MLKVLIADDEPRVGQLVKHLIHWDELGLSFVDICRDGRTALERIEQGAAGNRYYRHPYAGSDRTGACATGDGAISADAVCSDQRLPLF